MSAVTNTYEKVKAVILSAHKNSTIEEKIYKTMVRCGKYMCKMNILYMSGKRLKYVLMDG